MKEADFQRWIVDVAFRFGWHVWHVPAPMRMGRGGKWVGAKEGAGLPDLILLHDDPPRLLFLEVKGPNGQLSDEQKDFLSRAKLVADVAIDGDIGVGAGDNYHPVVPVVGVHAVWPGQEPVIEQMLRSKKVE